jgi:S-layer homology domain.
MNKRVRQWLQVMLAALVLWSGFGPISAARAEEGGAPNAAFTDVPDTHWAQRYIVKMALKGVVTGYTDGSFRPERPVSRQEAVLMALRVMGLEEEAESSNISYTLEIKADPYFKKYLDYAIQAGLINYTEEMSLIGGGNPAAWGSSPASREWIAKLTIRAIGKQPEKIGNMTFSDQQDISAWALEYVNAAVNLGIVNGKNGRFAPKDTVTRAELATFFSRADRYLEQPANVVAGTVAEVTPYSVTIRPDGQDAVRLTVDDVVYVYADGDTKRLPWSSVQPYYQVYAIAFDGSLKYLEITDDEAQLATVQGKLVRFDAEARRIALNVEGEAREYAFDPSAFSMTDAQGAGLDAAQLVPGSTVELRVVSVDGTERATELRVLRTPVYKSDVEASIVELNLTAGTLKVQDANAAAAETFPLSGELLQPGATVAYGSRTVTLNELRTGDKIRYSVTGDIVTAIELVAPVQPILAKETGTVSYYDSQDRVLYYKPVGGQPIGKYLANSQVEVVLNGVSGATMGDIEQGDEVALYLDQNDRIVKVEILNRSIVTEYMLTLRDYWPEENYLIVSKDKPVFFEADKDTKFYNNLGVEIPANQLASTLTEGKKLDLTYSTVNNRLIAVRVSWQYDGTVVSIDQAARKLVLETAGKDRITFTVPVSAYVEIAGRTSTSLSDVKVGDQIRILLSGANSTVGTVQLKQTMLYKVDEIINAALRKVKLVSASGAVLEEIIPAGASIRSVNGGSATFADVTVGKDLFVTFIGRTITEVVIANVSFGKVTAVDTSAGVFTIRDYNGGGALKRFAIPQGQPVITGDRVYVITDPQGAITVTVLEKIERKVLQYDAATREVSFYKTTLNDQTRYKLHQSAVITRADGTLTNASALKRNASVNAYLYDGMILELEISE